MLVRHPNTASTSIDDRQAPADVTHWKRAHPEGGSISAEAPPTVHWLERVRGEYREMPGLCLTELQAQRLWGLDAASCRALFDALLQSGFLRRTERGCYVRIGR